MRLKDAPYNTLLENAMGEVFTRLRIPLNSFLWNSKLISSIISRGDCFIVTEVGNIMVGKGGWDVTTHSPKYQDLYTIRVAYMLGVEIEAYSGGCWVPFQTGWTFIMPADHYRIKPATQLKKTVNHINGNKLDNSVNNLERTDFRSIPVKKHSWVQSIMSGKTELGFDQWVKEQDEKVKQKTEEELYQGWKRAVAKSQTLKSLKEWSEELIEA